MAGELNVSCPSCGKRYALPAGSEGKKAKCRCGSRFTVQAGQPRAAEVAVGRDAAPAVAQAPPPPAEASTYDFLDDALASAASNQTQPCPNCGMGLSLGAVLCTHCGTDLRTGRAARTKVTKQKTVSGSFCRTYDRWITRVGNVVGAVFALATIAIGVVALNMGHRKAIKMLLFGVPVAAGLGFSIGMGFMLMFAPTAYLESEHGQYWLQKVGVSNPVAARAVVIAVFVVIGSAIGWFIWFVGFSN